MSGTREFGNHRSIPWVFVGVLGLIGLVGSVVGAPYEPDPEVVKQIESLKPGQSLLLPPVRHFLGSQPISGKGHDGPYARDYTNKMVYDPDRQTALYAGGNHGIGRSNDVWEFDLAGNAWHQLHDKDGGDHARFKFSLMFYPRMVAKNPNPELTDVQQREVADCQKWWAQNVVLVDGNFVTRETHAPLLVGHTWDTLMYDPVNKRMVHGTGAHCANLPWLEYRFNGTPLAEVESRFGKRSDGVPWRRPWLFDPVTGRWLPYANISPLAKMDGMGGSLLYIPDQQKAVWYYCGQNTPDAPHTMCLWDLKNDTWEEMHPNAGIGVTKLGLYMKVAPEAEQQMVYVAPLKRIIAVMGRSTFAYDFATNQWSRRSAPVPFDAYDFKTVFAYDDAAEVCLLADPKNNRLAAYDPKADAWKSIDINPGLPKPPYCVGKGYYDPKYNVLVIQSAYTDRMWIYRY